MTGSIVTCEAYALLVKRAKGGKMGLTRLSVFVAVIVLLSPLIIRAGLGGKMDLSYGTGGMVTTRVFRANDARDVAVQADGKIVIVGSHQFNIWGFVVVRYNPDGSLDSTFSQDGIAVTEIGSIRSQAETVAIQSDGKILVAGNTMVAGSPAHNDFAVVRYNSDGSLDTTFDGDGIVTTQFSVNGEEVVADMVLLSDGRIVVGGNSSTLSAPIYARYNTNGTLDNTLDGDGRRVVSGLCIDLRSMALQTGDKLVSGGQKQCTFPAKDFAVWRFDASGAFDSTFDGDGIAETSVVLEDYPADLTVDDLDRIVFSGLIQLTPADYDIAVLRYSPNGTLDTSFDSDGIAVVRITDNSDVVNSVKVQRNGKIVLAGYSYAPDGFDSTVIRLLDNGSRDLTFGVAGVAVYDFGSRSSISSLAIQNDGRILGAGLLITGTDQDFMTIRLLDETRDFDFDGDARTDLSAYRPSLGQWWLSRSSSGLIVHTFGNASDIVSPGDFTGDGKSDVAIFRPSTGEWFVLRSEDSSFYSFPFGSPGDAVVPADYDGDGKTDPAVFRPSNSTWYIQRSSSGTTIQTFGALTDRPVPADYDGDGKTDIAIYRPSLGQWWINRSNAGLIVHTFGNSGDRNVPGDYTGDGKADVAIWRPSNGEWYILRSEDFSFYSFPFGVSTDLPVPGDYDGDGRTDAGVFRPSSGTWYVNRSTSGLLIQGFGAAGDLPVPGVFVR